MKAKQDTNLGMSNAKISQICSMHYHTKHNFRGVYASNRINTSVVEDSPPYFVICNTASESPGNVYGHWVCIYRNENYTTNYFCSLGKRPSGFLLEYIKDLGPKYSCNTFRYQPFNSSSCGEMALLYADFRSQGFSDDSTLSLFSTTNRAINDSLARNYVYGHMTLARPRIN